MEKKEIMTYVLQQDDEEPTLKRECYQNPK
jgi:hypothetical protein